MNLVAEFKEYGDAEDEAITSATMGDEIIIAFRFRLWAHDGKSHNTNQVRIYKSEGSSVGVDTWEDEQLVDYSGPDTWENATSFFTDDWTAGEYEAEVLIRDEVTGKVSEPEYATFTLE